MDTIRRGLFVYRVEGSCHRFRFFLDEWKWQMLLKYVVSRRSTFQRRDKIHFTVRFRRRISSRSIQCANDSGNGNNIINIFSYFHIFIFSYFILLNLRYLNNIFLVRSLLYQKLLIARIKEVWLFRGKFNIFVSQFIYHFLFPYYSLATKIFYSMLILYLSLSITVPVRCKTFPHLAVIFSVNIGLESLT